MPHRIESREEAITGVERAEEYGETHKKMARFMHRALLSDLKAFNIPGHYLEVGAGPGVLATIIAEDNPGIDITAVDLSPDMVAVAQRHVEESALDDRIRCVIGDVGDEQSMGQLGKFDLVYSTLSLHHWKDAERSISNLWQTLRDDGVLYIQDLKRVWWLYYLPLNGGFAHSVRAAYLPNEIKGMFQKFGIHKYEIKTTFPFFMQSIIAWK